MRKLKLFKSLLVVAMLLVGGVSSVWADATTLYEKGTTGHAWATADLDDWTFSGGSNTGQEISTGGYLRFYKINQNNRDEYTSTHSLTTTDDYVVTMNLLWNVENANGSGTAGCYVTFGDVTLFWCGQNRDLKITIGSTETTLISGGATNLRGTDFNVEISINKKTKDVSYSISNSLYNSGTLITGSGSSTTGEVSNVIFGWWRGGQQNNSSQIVKSIVVTEEEYSASTANYTVHFVDNNSATVKEDEVRNGEVGADVGANAGDKASFIADGNKYVYSSDGGGTTVTSNGEAEFTVTYTKYVSTAYTVKAQVSGSDLTTLASGTAYLDGSTTAYWSKYIKVNDQWYVADETTYNTTITAATTNVAFTETNAIDYFFEETDFTLSRSFAATSSQNFFSQGNGGRLYANSYGTTEALEGGVYELVIAAAINTQAPKMTYGYKLGDADYVVLGESPSFNNGSYEATRTVRNVIIPDEARFCWINNTEHNSNLYVDYVTLTKVESYPATIGEAGWATLYTPYALNFSGSGLTAYTATCDGTTVTLTEVKNVPANTGVVLKGAEGNYDIPVIASSSTAQGDLEGSATDATTHDVYQYDMYMLALNETTKKVQFTYVNDGSIAAGKAYLLIAETSGSNTARMLSVVFDDGDATGISNATAEMKAEDAIFNLAGQRVAQPANGLYIVNGKKVLVK